MRLRKLAAGAALIGMSVQVAAQPACLTTAEAETLVQAMLPSLIDNASEQCASYLPANSAIVARGDALSQRYTPAADMARDEAAGLALRVLDNGEDSPGLDAESGGELIIGLFEMGIGVALAEMLNAESCPTADRVFTALEPLPSRNFAGLLTLLIEIGSADDEEEGESPGPFAICQTATG
ncbi:hypothetical protein HFP51_04485 [Parasphingopyxis sp. CP4]|uniref:hypothetical protein n=1 Tax=Parasphingopyxis sp. CP4 TaxID=2724527 RepID=UPI0015A04F30|nr:hypothetical protein [Parasphingopyxis sp. CP4]QLC21501.1 hypothetical protein HFP51_04485 [Parasphingopyxis sp. CP4]